MPSPFMSSTGREVAGLCSACAREAVRASRTTTRAFSIRQTPRQPSASSRLAASTRTLGQRRWMTTTPPLRTPSAASQQASPSESNPSPQSIPGKAAEQAQIRTQVPPTPLPYYALFPQTLPQGPPPAGPFKIDVRALRREFLQLQAAAHPDFHHSAASSSSDQSPGTQHSEARRKAEAVSSHINAAFKTLSSPLLRAQYLLHEQFGIDLAGDEAGRLAEPDAELLMTVLDAREAIEGAGREEDLEGVRGENEARIEAGLEALEEAFAAGDVEGAKRETIGLRYWVNIREGISNWEPGKPIVLEH